MVASCHPSLFHLLHGLHDHEELTTFTVSLTTVVVVAVIVLAIGAKVGKWENRREAGDLLRLQEIDARNQKWLERERAEELEA